jgi:hypothetical protein
MLLISMSHVSRISVSVAHLSRCSLMCACCVRNNRDRPDIMVIDIGALGAVDVAHANNIPYVINNPSLLFRIDNNPHYVPGNTSHSLATALSRIVANACTNSMGVWFYATNDPMGAMFIRTLSASISCSINTNIYGSQQAAI